MIGLLKSRVVRVGIAVLVVLGLAYTAYAKIDQRGYERAEATYKALIAESNAEAARNAVEDYKAAQDIAGAETDKEIQIFEKIKVIEGEVPKIVEGIVEVKPECAVLPELGGVFTQQARAANGVSITVDPGELADPMLGDGRIPD